jgi:periplasmic divalent cation tolerance protein
MLVVFTTAPNSEEANLLAAKIVEEKLAACVQVLPQIMSHYYWDGAMQKELENLLLIKTLEAKFDSLERFIKENHSYDVPEIVSVKAEDVSVEYLSWMKEYLT